MKKRFLFMILLAGLTVVSSCKKDEEEEEIPETPTATAPSNPIPAPSSAFGALVAVQTATYVDAPFVGEIYQPVGVGVAVFGNLSAPAYVDGGAISVNGTALTKQSNNSYINTPGVTNPQGIDFGDDVNWNVGGNSTTEVPAFTHNPTNPMPSGPKYTGATTIGRTSDFTLISAIAITGADSIIYNVISPTATLTRIVDGTVGSVTFTAAEMGTLGAGNGYVQIVPYSLSFQTFGGKTIYFVNESVCTKSVTFN